MQLAGSFDLKSEQLDFTGHLLLDASLSETVTGYKSLLVRIAQPFFRRQGRRHQAADPRLGHAATSPPSGSTSSAR